MDYLLLDKLYENLKYDSEKCLVTKQKVTNGLSVSGCYLNMIGFKSELSSLKQQIDQLAGNKSNKSSGPVYDAARKLFSGLSLEQIRVLKVNGFEKEMKHVNNCSLCFDLKKGLMKIEGENAEKVKKKMFRNYRFIRN